jgi:hypothetical protein
VIQVGEIVESRIRRRHYHTYGRVFFSAHSSRFTKLSA